MYVCLCTHSQSLFTYSSEGNNRYTMRDGVQIDAFLAFLAGAPNNETETVGIAFLFVLLQVPPKRRPTISTATWLRRATPSSSCAPSSGTPNPSSSGTRYVSFKNC